MSVTFVQQLKNAPSVKGTFFASELGTVAPLKPDFIDRLASSMVCSSIALSSLYGFSKCINATAANAYWQGKLIHTDPDAVAEGQALYAWAFPGHCRSVNHTFGDYLNKDGGAWGAALADHVTRDAFVNTEILKIFAQANWLDQLNLVFYKIQRLDPARMGPVLDVWTKAYPTQGIVNTWERRTFIPAANFAAVPEQFIGEVNNAIMVTSVIGQTVVPGQGGAAGSPGRSFPRYGYGVAVQNYLNGRPKELGLTTGTNPDNDPEGGSGCFVPGTPVRLADGRDVPIEAVTPGDPVLARDGHVSIQSGERVILDLDRGEQIYGIDDGTTCEDPFFSAGHLFWTSEGWKAIEPATALQENPHRHVGELIPGDVVFRLRGENSVAYDEVRIKAFSRAFLPPGSRLHGLHLTDGPQSYHARGYLVAMNYPELTVQRLVHGFGLLSDAERRHLERHLAAIMPLLTRSIGPFIEAALTRAMAAADDSSSARHVPSLHHAPSPCKGTQP